MRLHRLEMTAFGPFAGTEEVDFDALADEGLHLIQGPTGAGKSSILDAICFALFAAVPRARGGKSSLHSDHAQPGSVPQVVLELTASGRRFRITRSPGFSRPKKRGTGETLVQPRVLLEEHLNRQWVAKGTRIDEVALVIDDVVGLGLEQFVKVVLLPQGEFAAFLRASPEERRGLLERLFDTSRFTDVEAWLARRRRESGDGLARCRERLHYDLQRVDDEVAGLAPSLTTWVGADREADGCDGDQSNGDQSNGDQSDADLFAGSLSDDNGRDTDASGEAADDGADVASQHVTGPDWPVWTELQPGQVGPSLDRMLLQVNEFAAEALAEVDAAESAVEATTEAAEQGRRVADLRGVGLAARDRLTALAEMAPAIAEQRDRLDRAERSRAVAGHLAAADRAAAELFRLDEELAAAESSARATCRAETLPAAVTAEDARAIADAVREHDALLTGARDAGSRVARLRGQQRAAEQRLGELEQRATDLASAQQEHATRREELTAQLDSLAATAAARAPREQDVTQLERAAHLVEQVAADEGRMPQLTSHLEACREAWRAAEKHVLSLRTARLEGVAGELAEKLVDGEDCPVCGSGEHPRPAQRSEGDLDTSHAAIDAAQEAAEEARAQQDKASAAVTSAEAALAARREELDSCLAGIDRNEPLSQDSVPVRLDEARVALAGARAAEQQLPQVRDRLQELTAAAETATAEVTGLRESRAGTRSQLEQAREDEATEHATVERLLGAHGGGCPCGAGRDNGQEPGQTAATAELQVAEVVAAHERAWRRLDRLATVLRDRESAAMRRDDALSERDRALAERGFAAVEDARAAQLPVAQVDEIARQLAEVDRTRAAAEADLDKPDVQQALTAQEPDLPALELQVREARGRLKTAGQTHTHLELAIQRLTDLAAALERTVDALGPAEAEHDLLAELAECVAGTSQDNTLRMRLSSYVLAARLEEVARYANERLAVMSDGRYSLQHSDARAARGARGGLGLTVTDAWTGVARETASLSGGESFMAALALALGLGDAVRAEAGGLDLQTLFIDEGFGSLDEDSLEQVMGVLDDLREGGRCVGIVSHVAELRQQIRAQVLVTKTTAGSHVEVTCRPDRETAA